MIFSNNPPILQILRGFVESIFMSGMMEFATIWCIGNESKTFISFVGMYEFDNITSQHLATVTNFGLHRMVNVVFDG